MLYFSFLLTFYTPDRHPLQGGIMALHPRLVYASHKGNIIDHPEFLMVASRGNQYYHPDESELCPLPPESELFFLPGRKALGLDPSTGHLTSFPGLPVSAFAAPGYTLSAHAASLDNPESERLPLFAYGAVGYADNRFWICATKVDSDQRQQFSRIPAMRINQLAKNLRRQYRNNRLINHIISACALKYGCPAAKNFILGRYEAPLPTSMNCNAHCLGCISSPQKDGAAAVTPQCRLGFIPTSDEIVETMALHERREKRSPIYSFGQGCEGDPLMNWELLADSIFKFRKMRENGNGGHGTINCNTNGGNAAGIKSLCEAGITSFRISLNSAVPEIYEKYYRPANYDFEDVKTSMQIARKAGVFVSLNFLWFPGLSDTERELEALSRLCRSCGVSMIQWRNLNIDPQWFYRRMEQFSPKTPPLGLNSFIEKLSKLCPWLRYGYFNPWLGDKAKILAPEI